jgi:DNA-binding NarL/FixJ family response regulator
VSETRGSQRSGGEEVLADEGTRLRISIVAEFEPLRLGLTQMLATATDFEVINQAESMEAVVRSSKSACADVLVVDAQALTAGFQTPSEWLQTKKLVFVGSAPSATALSTETIQLLMQAEALAFLSSHVSGARLIDAIRLVAAGTFVCDMTVIKPLFARLSLWASEACEQEESKAEPLTEREIEVLQLVARGLSNGHIAAELCLSEGTVKSHISSRPALVRYAMTRELLPVPGNAA